GTGPISATSVPPEDRTPIGPSVNNQIFPAHSTTALADVAASAAALVVEKQHALRQRREWLDGELARAGETKRGMIVIWGTVLYGLNDDASRQDQHQRHARSKNTRPHSSHPPERSR